MKKLLKLVSIILVMAMILPMTPIEIFAVEAGQTQTTPAEDVIGGEFATSKHSTSLTQYGQDIYSTGTADYSKAPAIDGKITTDEGWVCVTPDYVDAVRGSSLMNKYTGRGWDSSSRLDVHADPQNALNSKFKIYVAQTATKVYVAIEDYSGWVDKNGNGIFDDPSEGMLRNNYHLMFGFNPNDYSLLFKTAQNGDYIEILMGSNKSGVSDTSDTTKAILTNTASANYHQTTTSYGNAGDVVTGLAKDNKNYSGKPTSHWVAHLEFEFDKANIKAAYKNAFDVTLADDAFNTIFVGGQYTVYEGVTATTIQHMTLGSIMSLEQLEESGYASTYVPDAIVFGNEKSGSVYADCSFTGHSTEARYLVEGTTDTYYHTCTHCGMAGASTFKVVDDALVYDKEVVSDDTKITAGDCSTMGTYYKSCSCGLVSTNAADTFEFGGDHDFTAKVVADKYEQKAATCIAGGIYYVSCKYCGESSEGKTAEDTFTTAPTLWPAGAAKPVYHGQRTFYTGDNYTVKDSDITTTAWESIDSDLVLVTPNALTGTVVNNKNPDGGSVVTGATDRKSVV